MILALYVTLRESGEAAAGQAMTAPFNGNALVVSDVLVSGSWAMISGGMLPRRIFGKSAAISVLVVPLYFAAIVFLPDRVILACRRLLRLDAGGPT